MKNKFSKIAVALTMAVALILPSVTPAHAGSFSRSSSFSSSRSSSFSSSRSSYSSPSRSSYSSTSRSSSYSKPSTSSKSFFGGSSTKKSSTSSSFFGKKSTSTTKGSFSGRTSTVRGKTYKSTPTTRYYNGRSVQVNHYYHAGYSPYGAFGYYHGFTTGMFMGSLFHPWGGVYHPIGQPVAVYGASPIAWVLDLILLAIFLVVVIAMFKAFSPRKSVYRRRF